MLEDSPKSVGLADLLRAVVGDVRRMGGPDSRDMDRKSVANNEEDDDDTDNSDEETIKHQRRRNRDVWPSWKSSGG